MHVTVLGTGGTIASTPGEDGATPTESGSDLVDSVPELSTFGSLDVEDVAQVPSFELDSGTLERIADRVAELDADPDVDAVVLTHGTDTMEETAYYLDAALRPETPVFLTGAQRRPDEPSADGPPNLLTAFRAASTFTDAGGSGVFVAFDEEVHAARTVTKTHTSKLNAFQSPTPGPVATVDHGDVRIHRRPRSETDHVPATDLSATVHVVVSATGVSGDLVDAAVERGADGLVLQGTGLGNVTADVGAAVERVAADLPVVVTSRCHAGRTAPVYGATGGGDRLRDYGVLFADDLPAQKARLKLQLALSRFDSSEDVRDVFAD